MKTLYLVRHAKSSWKHNLDDHSRPLKKRGEEDGALVSNEVKSRVDPPEKIISSDATRALETARFFKDAFQVRDEDFEVMHDLYDFRGANVMKVIKSLDDDLNKVMIVGHNHAFTSVTNMLGDRYIENVPTTGFVAIQFDEKSWSDISAGKTLLSIFPRHVKK